MENGHIATGVVLDMLVKPFHDFKQDSGVEKGRLHSGLRLLPHEPALIQGDRLNLCDHVFRTALVHLMPGFEHLVRAFNDRLMDHDPYTLMLGQVQRLKGFQGSVFIDRFNDTGHNRVLLFPYTRMPESGRLLLKSVVVMQAAQNGIRHHTLVRRSAVSMFLHRSWQRYRRLRDARPQRHMGTPCVVIPYPFVQKVPQMICCERNEKIQTLALQRPKEPFTDRVGLRIPGRRFQHVQAQVAYVPV
jgi:hypothetical protein